MNRLIQFFDLKVAKGENKKEALEIFETLVKGSDTDKVLEASSRIAVCEFGPPILLERYKQGGKVVYDSITEQIGSLNNLLVQLKDKGYSNIEHINGILECVNYLKTTEAIIDSPEYLYEKALETFTANLEKIDRQIVLEGSRTVLSEDNVMETILVRTQAEFDLAFTKAFLGPEENFTLESMNELIRLSNRYDEVLYDRITLEASGIKKAALKLDEKSRAAANKIRQRSGNAGQTATIAKKSAGRFTALISNTIGKLDKMQREERLEAVLQGGMRRRLSTLIRTAIITGAAAAVHPALGAITLLTSATLHKRSDMRLKQEMINEYRGEIKLVQEKIRDAEAAGDRKKKYELMRIENHLEQSIERIKSPVRLNKPKLRKG